MFSKLEGWAEGGKVIKLENQSKLFRVSHIWKNYNGEDGELPLEGGKGEADLQEKARSKCGVTGESQASNCGCAMGALRGRDERWREQLTLCFVVKEKSFGH